MMVRPQESSMVSCENESAMPRELLVTRHRLQASAVRDGVLLRHRLPASAIRDGVLLIQHADGCRGRRIFIRFLLCCYIRLFLLNFIFGFLEKIDFPSKAAYAVSSLWP